MPLITDISATDVRFPTSLELDGSDAVNVDPDYSAAYVTIRAGEGDAAEVGHGLVFTAGRGNELIVAAVE
ncbi:fuconate dehydratase, partial [Mycobacterium tuberculosis]|nr:fuconate dehydratase [Mycobacterium tuberculosis]